MRPTIIHDDHTLEHQLIMHNLANFIAGALTSTTLAQYEEAAARRPGSAEGPSYLTRIAHNLTRAAQAIRQLQQPLSPLGPTPDQPLWDELHETLHEFQGYAPHLQLTITHHAPPQWPGPAHIHQAILHSLLLNCLQAQTTQLHVTVSTTGLSIQDNGHGWPQQWPITRYPEWTPWDLTWVSPSREGHGRGMRLVHHLLQRYQGILSVARRQDGPGAILHIRYD